jgi:ribosome biogenesis protein BRX1
MFKRKRAMEEGRDIDEERDEEKASQAKVEALSKALDTRTKSSSKYTNKQRVLVLSSRGVTVRQRHLLEDLKKLMPHHKTDSKLDTKGDIQTVNEVAELQSCNQVVYLEARKHQDLYMHIARAPHGPSIKFHVVNIHTMDELKLTGNCLLGSRPILNFDNRFETSVHWQVMKSILRDAFGCPNFHPKSKPFVDRVMSFFIVKNNIWVRNYQVLDKTDEKRKEEKPTLVEIGPRFVLVPIRIFSGSLGGATLYENKAYVSPNEERSAMKAVKGDRFKERAIAKGDRLKRSKMNVTKADPLANAHVFRGHEESDSD